MNEFEKLVAEMRAKQKEYFRTRNGVVLGDCKKLEKQVDDYLKNIENKDNESPTLF